MQVDSRVWKLFNTKTSDSLDVDLVTYPDVAIAAVNLLSRLSWMDSDLDLQLDSVITILQGRELTEDNIELASGILNHYIR